MRYAILAVALLGCEQVGSQPAAAPIIASPEAPQVEETKSSTIEHDPPPPPAPPLPENVSATMRWFHALEPAQKQFVRATCRRVHDDPCFGLLTMPVKRPSNEELGVTEKDAESVALMDAVNFCNEHNHSRRSCNTPLVAAFDGNVGFTSSASTFAFDPGVPVVSDWPTAPWIALDRDGDGAITSGAELFGDSTVLPDGTTAREGYSALAALDTNGDAVIDRRDPMFASLLLWSDANGDRKSTRDELRPLSSVVTSIPLAHDTLARCDRGNCEGARGAMTWRDATGEHTGAVVDVYLTARTTR